jgi:hypothetical protein
MADVAQPQLPLRMTSQEAQPDPVNDGELHVAVVSIVVAFCVLLRLKMTCQEVVDHLEWRRMERRVVGVVAIFGPPQPVHPPTCAADCQ